MRKHTVVAGLIMIIGFSVSCTRRYNPAITSEDLLSDLTFLATDSLKGRYPGTAEDSVLMDYIAAKFESFGLKPPGDGYIDHFEVLSAISPSDDNLLTYTDRTFVQGEDFVPMSYSSNDTVNSQVVFCGYGFEIKNDTLNRDDYAGRNVNGKWALIFKGEPENKDVFMEHSRDRDKILLAKDKGAAGVLFVSGTAFDPKDEFREERSKEPSVGVPALHIKRAVADQIMKGSGFSTEKTEKETLAKGKAPVYESKAPLKGQIVMIRTYSRTGNVAAVLEGSDPELKDQWVIIGAHEDHL
ncbi:MAG TPA: PA domain-containing protein, partial [Bacteroidales bacterium]|nr:PA domain-containing protein [Bacteroidales bacterium]